MRSKLFGAVATLALCASAAVAAPGAEHGGRDAGGEHEQADRKHPGGGEAHKGAGATPQSSADNDGHKSRSVAQTTPVRHEAKTERIATGKQANPQERQVAETRPDRSAPHREQTRPAMADRNDGARPAEAQREQRPRRADVTEVAHKDARGREFSVPSNDRVRILTEPREIRAGEYNRRKAIDGCPPGLARKYNDCTPPGLAKAQPARYRWSRPDWYYRESDWNGSYRYYDGYLVRLNPAQAVVSYVPLLGGALHIGATWPTAYHSVALPTYYTTYYDLSPNRYRYYDNTIYRVDDDDAKIAAVAALLTGNDFVIGQAIPAGYDVYNVPSRYRDQYYDGPNAIYRYSDGYIYQIDPTSRLIQAAIELLA